MKVIIVGCGRVGSTLAVHLVAENHDVCVIDRDPAARHLLPSRFAGQWVQGNGYNRATLDEAGIEAAAGFVAVTSGDNTNVVAARTAREEYRVPLVVARIYDPRRADLYRELGLTTVASVVWTVGRIHQMLLHRDLEPQFSFGNGETVLVRSALPTHLTGRPLGDLEVDAEIRVVEVTRGGRSFVPTTLSPAEPGDIVSFATAATALERLKGFLGRELGT